MSTGATLGAIVASLGAAGAFGYAAAIQHHQAGEIESQGSMGPGLLVALARRPLWVLGILADVLAVILQGVALRYGPVVLVQPLLVAGLPVAVVISAALARRRATREETRGLLACTLGLALVVPATSTSDLARATHTREAAIAGAITVAAVVALVVAARVRRSWAALTLGLAAGITVGAGSVLLAVCAVRITSPGPLLHTPIPYLAVLVAGAGLYLSQVAFQTGTLATPLAALSVIEPATAVVLAIAVLHERLPTGALVRVSGILGVVLATLGVLILARSQEKHELQTAGTEPGDPQ